MSPVEKLSSRNRTSESGLAAGCAAGIIGYVQLRLEHDIAAGDEKVFTGDKVGIGRDEKEDGFGDVLCCGKPSKRSAGDEHLPHPVWYFPGKIGVDE